MKNGCCDMATLYGSGDLSSKILTLDDLVQIALAKNLDLSVKEMEWKIQRETATGATRDMLPNLISNGEATKRNKNTGSFSESLEPGVPPAPPSISSEKHSARWDVTFTWNLLDFGISYFRARQEANRSVIQCLEYERLQQNLILDVAHQYWNAVVAKKAIETLHDCIDMLRLHQTILENVSRESLITEDRLLDNVDRIVHCQKRYNFYQKEYHYSKVELSRLLGIPPLVEMELALPESFNIDTELDDPRSLEQLALINRPELYTFDVQEFIDIDEVRALALEMCPGISLFAGRNYNENRFLLHNYWTLIGARATWDLLALPSQASFRRAAQQSRHLTKQNRLALSLAAISQVNLSYHIYHDEKENFLLAREAQDVKMQLLDQARRKEAVGRMNGAELIGYEVELRESEVDAWRAYGDMQYALEQVNNAIGMPLYYRNDEVRS